jgi:PIN domain nuclease of toxin-antitoxin system
MKLLLDTCTFLWIAAEPERVSKAATEAFLDPANERFLSAASAWEIAVKYSLGRLPLPRNPQFFIAQVREKSGVVALAIDEESALHTARLPKLHTDPFDRMLVAQAIVHGLTVVTPDEAIAQYPVRLLW